MINSGTGPPMPVTRRRNEHPGHHSTRRRDRQASATPCHTLITLRCCRIRLYGIKHAANGGADVADLVRHLACPPGRSRLLRAAWRPCSREPARRALVVAGPHSQGPPQAGASCTDRWRNVCGMPFSSGLAAPGNGYRWHGERVHTLLGQGTLCLCGFRGLRGG